MKICVYAICKNESKFVKKWLDSMQEADYIVVLDTGSEDDTYELLKNDPRVTRVEQKIIKPWRFDDARNESLKLVPEDTDIFVCTDLDELLDPGWADALRENWIVGFTVRCYYKYAWSHTIDGKPGRIFTYDKIHGKGWRWDYPVHEMLKNDYLSEEEQAKRTINLFDYIYLHHYPDHSKSRGSYLPLLELREKEYEEDYYGKIYLANEYYYRDHYQKAIDKFDEILENYSDKYNSIELASCHLFKGDCYRAMQKEDPMWWEKAIYNYLQSIYVEPTYREPYLYIAEVYNEVGLFKSAIGFVEDALRLSQRHFNWLERDDSWREKPDDILSVSYYNLGDLKKADEYVTKAFKLNRYDERIHYNYNLIHNERIKQIIGK